LVVAISRIWSRVTETDLGLVRDAAALLDPGGLEDHLRGRRVLVTKVNERSS